MNGMHMSTDATDMGGDNSVMNMAFHASMSDALYSAAWKPSSMGQYAGAIIFLILLAIIQRFLTAVKANQEIRWARAEKSRVVVVAGMLRDEDKGNDSIDYSDDRSTKGVKLGWTRKFESPWRKPWRWSTDLPRACLQTMVSGVGYLLMLAVMTFNIGYFMAVLTGLFLGELAFGRYTGNTEH